MCVLLPSGETWNYINIRKDGLGFGTVQTGDPISQQTHPLQPGKTRVYPSMLTNKQVPVLNLTETSITSQADLQDAFQSLCLCSHGGKESTEDQSTE